MTFEIQFDKQPEKLLKNVEIKLMKRLVKKIDALKINPVPHDAKRIVNRKDKHLGLESEIIEFCM